jgi:[acyl-carrier-protein] S-malonyltransferase
MRPAGEKLRVYLEKISLATPKINLLNNVDVKIESDPPAIRHALVRQAYSPVRWVETITKMRELGVTHVFECGPGRVLAGMTRRIDAGIQSVPLADRASMEKALRAVSGA